MQPFKATFKYLLLPLLVLLLLLFAAAGWMLATTGGSRWLIARATAFVPGQLSIEQVSGTLLGELNLRGIEYRQQQLSLRSEALTLSWQPRRLLQGELLIDRLELGDSDLHLPASSESQPAADNVPLQLPEQIALPLSVDLRVLQLHRVSLYPADTGEPSQQLSGAQLSARLSGGELQLRRLELQAPDAELNLTGSAGLGGDYPLDLSSAWTLRLPAVVQEVQYDSGEDTVAKAETSEPLALRGTATLQGTLWGELAQLTLQQQVDGALKAELNATLQQPLSDALQWQARLQLSEVDLQRLLPTLPPELADMQPDAQLEARGDLGSAQLTLNANANLPQLQHTRLQLQASASPQRIEIAQLSLQPQQGQTRLNARGRLDDPLGQRTLDLALQWQSLYYPLTAAAEDGAAYRSPQGSLSVQGSLDAYRWQLDTRLAGTEIPATQLKAQGQGDLQGLRLQPLQADTLGGTLDISGTLAWAPRLNWDLLLKAEQIQPGVQWPQLRGQLNTVLSVAGSIDQQLDTRIQIAALSGALQGQPVHGSGSLQVQGTALQIDRLQLGWGRAELAANGSVGEQLALQWQLNVPDLARLLPDAAGRIDGKGELSGARALPAIDAELNLSGLRYAQTEVGRLSARLQFDPLWQRDADIQLDARAIVAGGQAIDRARLSIAGNQQQLQLALDGDAGELGKLDLRAQGQLHSELQQTPLRWGWEGQVTRFDLSHPQAGLWQLQAPTTLAANQDRFNVEPLCWQAASLGGTACIEASGSVNDSNGRDRTLEARANIDQLSLTLLEPFIPDPTQLQGQLDATARYRLEGSNSRYDLRVALPEARFSLPDSDLELNLERSALTLNGDQDSAKAQLELKLAPLQGTLNGSLNVQELRGAQRLSGALDAQIEQLQPLALLLPQLQIQQGSARARLTLGGSVARPAIRGRLAIENGDLELPGAGIRVEQIDLNLSDDPTHEGEMILAGSARSGGGTLALQGRVKPLQQSAELSLGGERFEAANTGEVQLLVSPDLQLALSPQRVRVRGEVKIPQALIQAPKLEQGAVSASPDLVVDSGGDGAAAKGPELDVDMRLVLGDSVRVDAFGFNGLLTGALNLQQQGSGPARGSGSVGVVSGQYRLYGQDLNISRGNVIFTGGPLSNPGLDLRVGREVDEVSVGALVSGTLRKPKLELTSSPALPDNSILSYLLLGRAPDSTSSGEQQMLMKLALSLGAKGGTTITEKLTQSLNLDEIGFASGDTADDTSFYIGKYLSPDLYIKYGIGLVNPVNTFLMRYQLSKRLALETETSAEGSGGDLIYSFERD